MNAPDEITSRARHVAGFEAALQRMHDDPAEAERIDALIAHAGEDAEDAEEAADGPLPLEPPLHSMPLEGGGTLSYKAADPPGGPVTSGRVATAVRARPGTLESALAPVRAAVQTARDQFQAAQPLEIEIEFGVELTGAGTAVLVSQGATTAHLKVRLSWKPADGPTDDPGAAP